MNECNQFIEKLSDFDKDKLSYNDEILLLNHLEKCDNCREELEIYYIIEYGLNDYDEKTVPVQYRKYLNMFDFKSLVNYKINERKMFLGWFYDNEKAMNLIVLFNNCCLALVLLILIIIKFF